MQIRLKATGFPLTSALEELASEKLLRPIERRIGKEAPEDMPVDVELARTTRHHEEGKIWKCEVNLALPEERSTMFVEGWGESLEAAIDEAKDEIERSVTDYKGKRLAKFLRVARSVKEELRISRLARRAGNVYRWIRRR
mgnify:FL=1